MQDLSVGVKAAIQAFKTQAALAEALRIRRSAVNQWRQVPVKHVLKIEELTDGTVSRHVLRPDVYPREAA